ncbi:hypothetical protein SAMN05421874_1069 [Nonomuraea maritima]|uniref:Uncharacterized protein n=1 Tax=Nonomuraea maritima TaxID=683260 RepID=A0A1G9A3Y1_9ACTN|nr:DUF6422 family protein [Nonomuraea maritima]SDK21295.1 hypothetical protein SAMN05421874_1069 [Nonomuraea maritima]
MSTYQDLTAKQKSALESAALKVINARAEGRSMLMRAGIEPPSDPSWFGSPCGMQSCGCNDYTGHGGACETGITGPTGGAVIDTCGHEPSEHLET